MLVEGKIFNQLVVRKSVQFIKSVSCTSDQSTWLQGQRSYKCKSNNNNNNALFYVIFCLATPNTCRQVNRQDFTSRNCQFACSLHASRNPLAPKQAPIRLKSENFTVHKLSGNQADKQNCLTISSGLANQSSEKCVTLQKRFSFRFQETKNGVLQRNLNSCLPYISTNSFLETCKLSFILGFSCFQLKLLKTLMSVPDNNCCLI